MPRTTRKTTCNRDCPDACSMLVDIEDQRAVRLRGDPQDPVTAGFLCQRTSAFLERQYAPERFTRPMLRRDGVLQPVSWDEALDLAARKLEQARRDFGPACVLHYRSGGSLGLLKTVADRVFERFGPVSVKGGDICSGAGEAAQERDFGVAESNDLFDLLHSRRIFIWGKNPHVSGPHLLPVLREARRRGAELIGLDPIRTRCAELCDEFHQPRPGSDAFVALAMARHLFDRDLVDPAAARRSENLPAFQGLVHRRSVEGWLADTELDAGAVRSLAERYADGPSALLVGWGLGRRRNGSATVRCLDALGVLSGNVGAQGGGVSFYFGRRAAFAPGFAGGRCARQLSEARLGAEILAANDPPVRVAWITAGNPVSMLPDSVTVRRALEGLDFTVVVDTHPTDTTDVADLILPTRTLLEDDDLMGAYGNHWLRESRPALDAPEGCRHELDLWRDLAERLGLAGCVPPTVDAAKREQWAKVDQAGVPFEQLSEGPVRSPFAGQVVHQECFATDSGKARLIEQEPGPPPQAPPGEPLMLMALSDPRAQSSQWMDSMRDRPMEARVHPDSSAGLATGAPARIHGRGRFVDVVLQHDPTLRPGLLVLPKGGMMRDGRGINALLDAEQTDDGGGAVYYDGFVRLGSPAAASPSPTQSS